MAIISRQKTVAYTPQQMFDLVNDVLSYPEFVPCCQSASVEAHSETDQTATLCFAKGGLNKSFTTRNRIQANKMIEMQLVNGPFKHLHGFWRFEAVAPNQCKIAYDMEYEIAGHMLSMMFGPLFNQIANRLVEAFCQRAEVIYGKQAH